jgi:hypothetical protein
MIIFTFHEIVNAGFTGQHPFQKILPMQYLYAGFKHPEVFLHKRYVSKFLQPTENIGVLFTLEDCVWKDY